MDLMATAMALLDNLAEPWLIPALVSIASLTLGAQLTLRANVRQKAWEQAYSWKRSKFEGIIALVQECAQLTALGVRIVDADETEIEPLYGTVHSVQSTLRFDQSPAEFERLAVKELPSATFVVRGPRNRDRVERAAVLTILAILERLGAKSFELAKEVSVMQLYAREPHQLIQLIILQQRLAAGFQAALGGKDKAELEEANREWLLNIDAIIHELREDLMHSARNFRAATSPTRRFRKHFRKAMGNMRDDPEAALAEANSGPIKPGIV